MFEDKSLDAGSYDQEGSRPNKAETPSITTQVMDNLKQKTNIALPSGINAIPPTNDIYPQDQQPRYGMVGGFNILEQPGALFPLGYAQQQEEIENRKQLANNMSRFDILNSFDPASIKGLKDNLFQDWQYKQFEDYLQKASTALKAEGIQPALWNDIITKNPEYKLMVNKWHNIATNYDETFTRIKDMQLDPQAHNDYPPEAFNLAAKFDNIISSEGEPDINELSNIMNKFKKIINLQDYLKGYDTEAKTLTAEYIQKGTNNPDYDTWIKTVGKKAKDVFKDRIIKNYESGTGYDMTKQQKEQVNNYIEANTPDEETITNVKKQNEDAKLKKEEALASFKEGLKTKGTIADRYDTTTGKHTWDFSIINQERIKKGESPVLANVNGTQYIITRLEKDKQGYLVGYGRKEIKAMINEPLRDNMGNPMTYTEDIYDSTGTPLHKAGEQMLKGVKLDDHFDYTHKETLLDADVVQAAVGSSKNLTLKNNPMKGELVREEKQKRYRVNDREIILNKDNKWVYKDDGTPVQ